MLLQVPVGVLTSVRLVLSLLQTIQVFVMRTSQLFLDTNRVWMLIIFLVLVYIPCKNLHTKGKLS